jgi:hexokinase
MKATEFIEKHRLDPESVDLHQLVETFRVEMENGLSGLGSSLRMIPTYIEAENDFITDQTALAIDAGGTNFRYALMKIDEHKGLEIMDMENGRMPGLEGEISKEAFFKALAEPLKPLADQSARIGFCFSYPTEILPTKDGRLLQFCKEVQAPEVVGQLIGENLLASLNLPGMPIVLLNDTVATLLAGKSANMNKRYDSFIGFILGTGTNTCYIEKNEAIAKNRNLDLTRSQIINIESGNFNLAPRSGLDIAFDNTTMNPGQYTFEKMMSGGYLGGLCLFVMKAAAREGVFTPDAARKIINIPQLTSEQMDQFISNDDAIPEPLSACFTKPEDDAEAIILVVSLIQRAALLVAGNLAAVILKTGKGKSEEAPILITIEGSTYYKLYRFREMIENYLSRFLTGPHKRFYEFAEVSQSSLVGAGLAALIIED